MSSQADLKQILEYAATVDASIRGVIVIHDDGSMGVVSNAQIENLIIDGEETESTQGLERWKPGSR